MDPNSILPKLSVLIPVWNCENYIDRCLNSLLNQGIPEEEFEILIMDDGSQDASWKILKTYEKAYPNIQLLAQTNMGPCRARNALFEAAKGTYVYFLDADDYILCNSLGKILALGFEEQLDIISFETAITHDPDVVKEDVSFSMADCSPVTSGEEFLMAKPSHRYEVWWYVIKREFIEQNGLSFQQMMTSCDIMYTIQAFSKANRVLHVPRRIHRYFRSSNSITRNGNPLKNERLINNIFKAIEDLGDLITLKEAENGGNCESGIVKYLKAKRSTLVRHFLLQMLKKKFGYQTIKNMVFALKQKGLYPISGYYYKKPKPLKFRLLEYIINKESILFPFSLVYSMFYGKK